MLERVSSATAFLFRYVAPTSMDAEARVILDALAADDRRVLEVLATVPDLPERLRTLGRQTGDEWSRGRYERAEQRALRALRQRLAQADLLQP